MYFAGIYINPKTGSGSAVVFEKVLSSAKKLYLVKDIKIWHENTPLDEFVRSASDIFTDTRFLRKKKVFSQNKRPPKNTYTPPVIIVSTLDDEAAPVDRFRDEKIPVEAIAVHGDKGWRKEESKILRYGANYHVNREDVAKTLGSAYKKERILYDDVLSDAGKLQTDLERFINGDQTGSGSEELNALSLAVWHCERIKQIKRY